jgi:hypothetical protein
VQRRLRVLPSRAGVYFVLALGMFPHLGYARVWGKLTAGLAGLDVPRPSTTKQGQAGPIPDLVNRDFGGSVPGAKMVGDITYIPTWQGWAFLATVIDCATRKCVGWAVDDNYRTPLITAAVKMAARNIDLPEGAIFHSDRGSKHPGQVVQAGLGEHQLGLGGGQRRAGQPPLGFGQLDLSLRLAMGTAAPLASKTFVSAVKLAPPQDAARMPPVARLCWLRCFLRQSRKDSHWFNTGDPSPEITTRPG